MTSLGSHYIVTCRSDEVLEWYHKALVAHVTYREDPLPFVSRALEIDDSLLLVTVWQQVAYGTIFMVAATLIIEPFTQDR